jgi:hypothetical protein
MTIHDDKTAKKRYRYAVKLEMFFEAMGKSHPEIYRDLGIPKQLFSQIMHGQHEPRAGIIMKIHRIYGIKFTDEDFDFSRRS